MKLSMMLTYSGDPRLAAAEAADLEKAGIDVGWVVGAAVGADVGDGEGPLVGIDVGVDGVVEAEVVHCLGSHEIVAKSLDKRGVEQVWRPVLQIRRVGRSWSLQIQKVEGSGHLQIRS